MSLHPQILSQTQERLLAALSPLLREWHFYLGGGTAIALHLGHRRSVDFDWFRREGFEPLDFLRLLEDAGRVTEVQTERSTLHAVVDSVRVSFLAYDYPLLGELVSADALQIELASIDDLAAMKLAAMLQRGERKDFFDMAAILETGRSLADLFALFERKYGFETRSSLLRALTYFDEAEATPDPVVLWPHLSWEGVKTELVRSVREFADG